MLASFLARFGYAAIAGLLFAAGLAVPVPEELTLLTAGFLAHEGFIALAPTLAVCWAGILGGDFVFFVLARRHGDTVLSTRAVRRFLTPRRREWLERHFATHAFWTIFVARHTSGLRLPAFALAGTHGVRRRTFLLADGLSALVSVPIVVGLGYLFSAHLEDVHRDVRRVELGILAAVLLLAGIALLVRRRRQRGGP